MGVLLSGLSESWSAVDAEMLALLVASVLRMVDTVLVRTLGPGPAAGLWTHNVDSDLNLWDRHRRDVLNLLRHCSWSQCGLDWSSHRPGAAVMRISLCPRPAVV